MLTSTIGFSDDRIEFAVPNPKPAGAPQAPVQVMDVYVLTQVSAFRLG